MPVTSEDYDNVPGWKKLALFRQELEETKEKPIFPVDSKMWFNKEANEKMHNKFWTAPFDARFPQTNQTRHCWQYYIDFHRCQSLKGADYEPCDYFKAVYQCMCPQAWIDKFDNWVEEDRFPYDLSK